MFKGIKEKHYIRLSLLACIMLVVSILFLLINHLAPFGDGSLAIMDANIQYLDFFMYYKRLFQDGFHSFYTYGMTLGDDAFALFTYYLMSPVNLIFLLFDNSRLPVAFNYVVLIKLILCSLTCQYYIYQRFEHKVPVVYELCFSICYALMQYNIAQSSNIMWLDGVILLPLMMLGIYKLIKDEKVSIFLILMTGLSIIFNWYSGLINCIFSFFYFVFEYLINKPNKKVILYYFVNMFLGILLSMCILYPSIVSLRSGRGSLDLYVLGIRWRGIIIDSLQRFMIHGKSEVNGVSLYCGSIVLISCISFFTNSSINKREKWIVGEMLVLNLLFYYFQPFHGLFSFIKGAYSYWYRYSYVSIFFLIWISAKSTIKIDDSKSFWVCVIVLLTIQAFLQFYLKRQFDSYYIIWLAFVIVSSILLLKVNRKWLLLVVVITELLINTKSLIIDDGKVISVSKYAEYVKDEEKLIKSIYDYDSSSYRILQLSNRYMNANNLTANYDEPIGYGFASITGYTSDTDAIQQEFLDRVGYRLNQNFNITNSSIISIDSLLGVKYVLSPWAINELDRVSNLPSLTGKDVYQNQYMFPLAFFVDIKEEEIVYKDNPFLYQNELFSKLFGEKIELFTQMSYRVSNSIDKNEYLLSIDKGNYAYYGNLIWDSELNGTLMIGDSYSTGYAMWKSPSVFYIPTSSSSDTVKVVFDAEGDIAIQEEQFYRLNLDVLKELSNRCNQIALSNALLRNGEISFNVNSDQDQELFLSIPVKDGWIIKIDGEVIQPKVFEQIFYVLPIEKGNHYVEMKYHTPGIYTGVIMSLVGIVILGIFLRKKSF